jgi:hypothetical protein
MAATWVDWKEQTHTVNGWLQTRVQAIVTGEPISARRPDLVSQPLMHVIESGMAPGITPGAFFADQ